MSEIITDYSRPLELSYRKVYKGARSLRRLPEGMEGRPYKFQNIKCVSSGKRIPLHSGITALPSTTLFQIIIQTVE